MMDAPVSPEMVVELTKSLDNALVLLRVGMATGFGISFLLNGVILQRQTSVQQDRISPNNDEFILKLSRFIFVLATALTIAYFTIAMVHPYTSMNDLVHVGIALVLSLLSFGFDRLKNGLPAMSFLSGAFIWLIIVIFPFLFPKETSVPKTVSWLSGLHVSTAIAGEGLFVAAFFSSLLYLWVYRNLKLKIIAKIPNLPSLSSLDNIIEKSSLAGLFLITTSLVSGLALVSSSTSPAKVGYTKIIWAFSVWGWYVLCIFGRGLWGWRGRKGAQLSLWGTAILLLALFGTVWDLVLK